MIIKNIFIFLVVFLPIIFNPFGFEVFALPRLGLLYTVTTILTCLYFWDCLKARKIIYKKSPLYFLIGIFLFFIVLSIVFSRDIIHSLFGTYLDYEGLFSWLCYFILFFLASLYFTRDEDIKHLFLALSIPLFTVSCFAILQYFDFIPEIIEWEQRLSLKRAFSFLGHPSFLGVYLALLLPIYINFIRLKNLSRQWRSFIGLTIILGFISLALSFSRGAWIGFGLAMIFLSLINFRRIINFVCSIASKIRNKKSKTTVILLFAACCLLFVIGYLLHDLLMNRIISIFDFSAKPDNSVYGRLLLWKQTWNLIKDNFWLGVGPDNYVLVISQYFLPEWEGFEGTVTDKAHNEILHFWASFGIFGLLSYLSILIFLFSCSLLSWWRVSALRNLKNDEEKERRNNLITNGESKILFSSILAGLIGYFGAVQFHYSSIDLAPLFWIFAGMLASSLSSQGATLRSDEISDHEEVMKQSYSKQDGYEIALPFVFHASSKGVGDSSTLGSLSITTKLIFYLLIALLLFVAFASHQFLKADRLFIQALRADAKGELDLAIKNLEKAIEKNDRVVNFYTTLALFYEKKARITGPFFHFDQAIEVLEKAVKNHPYNYRAHFALAELYLKASQFAQNKEFVYRKAKESYKKTVELYPNFSEARLKLGVVYAHLDQSEEALTEWKECIIINNKRGCFLNQNENLTKKKKCATILNRRVECFFNQARLYEKLGNKEKAQEYYQKALKIDPEIKEAQEALKRVTR